MLSKSDDYDFPLYPEAAPHPMYSPEFYHIGSLHGLDMGGSYGYPRTAQDPYPTTAAFPAPHMYELGNAFASEKQSPNVMPVGSPEARAPPSNISTASAPSASSSAMGSPYSSHGQPVSIPEWTTVATTGLGIQPGIVAYGDFNEYSYGPSGMDDQFATFPGGDKSGFVGEYAKLPESTSRPVQSFPSSPLSTFVSSNVAKTVSDRPRSGGFTPRSSPNSAVTPTGGSNDNQFKSPSTPASATSPLSKRRFSTGSASSAAGRRPDARSSPIFQDAQSGGADQPFYSTYHQSSFFSQTSGQFVAPLESSYPTLIIHPHIGAPQLPGSEHGSMYPPPQSPTPSIGSNNAHHQGSQSPYLPPNTYPYPPYPRGLSVNSYGSHDSTPDSEVNPEASRRCPNPDCGKVFKDLKAHMLTHQNERPEKCPIATCDYHIKGFARKYDKNRHTLTHYKGTMVCGFCPGSGSAAEKSFNRADVFKRHLTSVHAVEQTAPNSRKKTSGGLNTSRKLTGYAPDATGKCSTCSVTFNNAQDFYEHLDDCVLRIVQQEDPSEAINARRLAEVENDPVVHEALRNSIHPATTVNHFSADEEEDDEEMEDADDDDYAVRGKSTRRGATKLTRTSANGAIQKSRSGGLTHSKGGVALHPKGRKKRKDYPSSWGKSPTEIKMKKRVLCTFDGVRRLWKDDMLLLTDYEVRLPLADGKSYVTDLDVETVKRAEGFHGATDEEKGAFGPEELSNGRYDLHSLMEVKSERQ